MQSGINSRPESWPRCPEAAEFFGALFRAFAAHNPVVSAMSDRFVEQAGVPLPVLVDHWAVPSTPNIEADLTDIGMRPGHTVDGDAVWTHPAARLPRIRIEETSTVRMAVCVDDIRTFAEANDLPLHGQHGDPDSGYEEARYPLEYGELAAVVRSGYRGFRPGQCTAADQRALASAREALRGRKRDCDGGPAALETAGLMRSLAGEIDRDRVVDEFFDAEREYYMRSNGAARWQYGRQQQIGIGWANHDHHTYRSSRAGFQALMGLWGELGFETREKFYAGAEAGWGAQILEHPVSRVVLFCDVDMAPDEIGTDFSATPLPELPHLGTIGLWCGLHGESIGRAGLHHLESEFDFTAVGDQMSTAGVGVMAPFTDLPMLKQAFTVAEKWTVDPSRAAALFDRGLITKLQRDRSTAGGAPGSHLEILQRWEGFKGFNKTGIDAIILGTDARRST